MRFKVVVFLFLFISKAVFSVNIDSLKTQAIAESNDSLRVSSFIKLANQYESINVDSALFYYQSAIDHSVLIGRPDLQAKATANMAFAYHYTLSSFKCVDYMKEAVLLYEKCEDANGLLDAYYNLGSFYGFFEVFPDAIEWFLQAADLGEHLNNPERLGMIYNNLGLMYRAVGEFSKSNEFQFKALAIKQKIGDNTISYTHLNIGQNFSQQEDFTNAFYHYSEALRLFRSDNDTFRIAIVYNQIGALCKLSGDFDDATLYYDSASVCYQGVDYTLGMAKYYVNVGDIAVLQGDNELADRYFKQALAIVPSQPTPYFPGNDIKSVLFNIYEGLLNVAMFHNSKFDIEIISKYGKEMLSLANEMGSLSRLNLAYKTLYEVYRESDNASMALQYVNLYLHTSDSLSIISKQRVISEMQIKYDTEQKASKIELLSKEKELVKLDLLQSIQKRKSQRILILILILGVLLTSVFIVLIYRFNNKLKNSNALITKQKHEKELLLNEIHHRVKNNLQIIAGLLDLQLFDIKDEKARNALIDARSRVKTISSIHKILYQIEDNKTIHFEKFTRNLTHELQASLQGAKKVDIQLDIPSEIQFNVDVAIPLGLIMTELLTNAFKYAFAETSQPTLYIMIKYLDSNKVELKICDNGVGLPPDFDLAKSNSMGYRIVNSLAIQLSGTCTLLNEGGACFTLNFQDDKVE